MRGTEKVFVTTGSRRGLLLNCLALGGLAACGGTRLPDFAPATPAVVRASGEPGLAVDAYPMRDRGEQKKYFGTVLAELGIAPCWLSLRNDTANETILFDAGDVAADAGSSGTEANTGGRLGKSESGLANTGGAMFLVGSALLMPGVQLIAMPMLILGSAAIADAQEVKRNILAKQLTARTLYPREAASGFLYLKAPGGNIAAGTTLIVRVHRRRDGQGDERDVAYQVPI